MRSTRLVGVLLAFVAVVLFGVVARESVFERQRRTFGADGLVGKFRDGLTMAGSFLGIDTSKGVANLVSTSLLAQRPSWLLRTRESGVFASFFRLLGFDSTKLTAIALNGLIFIAQLISSNVATSNTKLRDEDELEERIEPPSGSPLSWLLDGKNTKLPRLVAAAHSRSLSEDVVAAVRAAAVSSDGACVVLLACKGAPLIRAMQRGLRVMAGDAAHGGAAHGGAAHDEAQEAQAWRRMTPVQRMYAFWPDVAEFRRNGELCDLRHPGCDY